MAVSCPELQGIQQDSQVAISNHTKGAFLHATQHSSNGHGHGPSHGIL